MSFDIDVLKKIVLERKSDLLVGKRKFSFMFLGACLNRSLNADSRKSFSERRSTISVRNSGFAVDFIIYKCLYRNIICLIIIVHFTLFIMPTPRNFPVTADDDE